ncbi:hypothetical protein Rsub_00613 [Raphidocelis subcapitata]|uniref:Uncharacterized protein n=1 Tax=Raphidocelis subcapitata TaxID=307507 RepID=A0A2V0NKN8_9CHLO|nr:hypothetical protein Rsub_00613 [Raphidocelis subcapitata]|eukprot:GBF87901.1 hypothetical protein Rsub_00613 [Raphidocelis subcapitata]
MAFRHTMSKFFPTEAYPVVAPVAAASVLFAWMMARTIISDPDGHANARAGLAALDDKTAEARGAGWRGSIRSYFSARVSAGEIGIFPNKV